MQLDRMFSAEVANTIKRHKKTERGTSTQWNGDPALSYNGAKTATHKNSFKSSAINGRAKEGKKKRNCECADGERREKMNDEHLKKLTMPRTILFYKNYI